MFETATVHMQHRGAHHRAALLTASVAAHTLIAVAAIAASIHSISFPTHAPNQSEIFTPVIPISLPGGGAPRPPAPRPAAAAAPPAAPAHAQVTAPPEVVAPQQVPDAIPTVSASTATAVGTSDATTGGGGVIGATGDSDMPGGGGGDPNSIGIGGTGTSPVPNVVFHAGADVKSAVVISRVQPVYPPLPLRMRMNGSVVVHCVIDRNGHVRDAEVVRSTSSMFNESALDAVQRWTFAPGSMHGQAVDTYFDLTVTFALK
jgi:TonB family protein